MPIHTFRSEAYYDGETFYFEANFTELMWQATVRDDSGRLRGKIMCSAPDLNLSLCDLEDGVCDWVHRCIANKAGIFPSEIANRQKLRLVVANVFYEVEEMSRAAIECARSKALRSEMRYEFARLKAVYESIAIQFR